MKAQPVRLTALVRQFWAEESGATAIEYGLIAGMMSIVAVGIAASGGALDGVYRKVSDIVAALGGGGGGG